MSELKCRDCKLWLRDYVCRAGVGNPLRVCGEYRCPDLAARREWLLAELKKQEHK